MTLTPDRSRFDLTECDREPIHIPAAIQPHGALVVVKEGSLRIMQASENVPEFFALRDPQVVGCSLDTILNEGAAEKISNTVMSSAWADLNPLPVASGELTMVVHPGDRVLLLEFERAVGTPTQGGERTLLRRALVNIQTAQTLADLGETVIREVKRLTRFERVMLYRFSEEGHGHVAAEVRDPHLDAYIGIHYPASDIPRQARALYTQTWLRLIPDAAYVPVPIIPAMRPDTGAPLDLSQAVLRSVSPVHREYLRNMGVRASMSISLVVRGELWGLISCTNHSAPLYLPHEIRSTCEVIGRLASLEFEALEERQAASAREARRSTESRLADAMRKAGSDESVLRSLMHHPVQLLGLVGAGGAAVVDEEECTLCGDCPPPGFVRALCEWLEQHGERSVFSTSSLPALYPPAEEHKSVASGILAIALPGTPSRWLVWFRPERIHTVKWGGDPRKPVEHEAGSGPHPRRSFALWKEEVRLRSTSWDASDIEAATSLRRYAVEIDLERQLARQQQAVRARDEIMAIVSHDLRSPLSVMDMQARILLETSRDGDDPMRTTATRIQRSVARMNSLIDNLLDLATIEAGGFSLSLSDEDAADLLDDSLLTLAPLAESKGVLVDRKVVGAPRVRADRARVFQVIANLFSNAVKFTPPDGKISLRVEDGLREVLFTVTDTGIGIDPDDVAHIFDRYWRVNSEGVGIGLFVVKGIVKAHGGTIRVTSKPGAGSTFMFTLPAAPEQAVGSGE